MISLVEPTSSPSMLPTRRDVVARLFRQRTTFVGCFLLVLLLCALTGQYHNKYQAEMAVLVRKERVDSVLTAVQNSTPVLQQLEVSEQELNSEAELLKSYDLLQAVALQTGLSPATGTPVTLARAVRRLQGNLEVSVTPKTELIYVRYTADDPQTAQRVLHAVGNVYLQQQREMHGQTSQLNFFDEQVTQHASALQKAEQQLRAFTLRTGVVSGTLERDLAVQQINALSAQETSNRADLASALSRASSLDADLARTSPRISTATRTSDNMTLLGDLHSRLLGLELKRSELVAKYDPRYRLVQDVDDQIAIVQQMLSEQSGQPVKEATSDINPVVPRLQETYAQTRAELAGLTARQADLSHSDRALRRQASALQSEALEQEDLLRNLKTEQEQYQLYVDKREESRMASQLDKQGILNVLIAQPASAPALPQHSRALVILMTLISALFLSLGAAFLADMFDPTVRSGEELAEILASTALVEEFGAGVHSLKGVA